MALRLLSTGHLLSQPQLIGDLTTEEPRRSGRATKGQHNKTFESEIEQQVAVPTAGKGVKSSKSSKQTSKAATPVGEDEPPEERSGDVEENEGDEDEQVIRCICGVATEDEDEDEERMFIQCDRCNCWQHNDCMELSEDPDAMPDSYLCEECDPNAHKSLLQNVARGEKPWEEAAVKRAASKKGRRKKGGRRSKAGAKTRTSNASEKVDEEVVKQEQAVTQEKRRSSEPMGPPDGRRGSGNKRKLRGEPEGDNSALDSKVSDS